MRGSVLVEPGIKEINLGGIVPLEDRGVTNTATGLFPLLGSFVDTLFSLIGISFRILFTILGLAVETFISCFLILVFLISLGFNGLFQFLGWASEFVVPRLPEIFMAIAFGLACMFVYSMVVWFIDFIFTNISDIITVIVLILALALASD